MSDEVKEQNVYGIPCVICRQFPHCSLHGLKPFSKRKGGGIENPEDINHICRAVEGNRCCNPYKCFYRDKCIKLDRITKGLPV